MATLAIDVTFKTSKEGHRYLFVGSYVTAVAENMAKEDEVEKEAREEGEDPSEDPFEEMFDEEGALRIEGEDREVRVEGEERGAVRVEGEERGAVRVEGERREEEHLALGGLEGMVTRTIMLVEPLKTRRAAEVIVATQSMVAKLRWWGFEVTRLHSDRGRELVSTALRRWAVSHGLYKTLSSPDEPQANGRAEAAVGWVKRKARALLLAAGANANLWHAAALQAVEIRNRKIMREMGSPQLQLPVFGQKVVVKKRRWKREAWEAITQNATYVGPCPDMTFKGGSIYTVSQVVPEPRDQKVDIPVVGELWTR